MRDHPIIERFKKTFVAEHRTALVKNSKKTRIANFTFEVVGCNEAIFYTFTET